MKKVESVLKGYPVLKAEINRLKIEIQKLDYMGITAQPNEQRPSTPTNKTGSAVESEVLHREEHKAYLQRLIDSKELDLSIIDNALSALTEDETKLIEIRYFKQRKRDDVAELYQVDPKTISQRCMKILNKLEPLIVM